MNKFIQIVTGCVALTLGLTLNAQLPLAPSGTYGGPLPQPAPYSQFTTSFWNHGTGVLYDRLTTVEAGFDVNADVTPDFIVACPGIGANWSGSSTYSVGRVEVRSGTNGSIIHQFVSANHDKFGTVACGMGDVNGDGRDAPSYLVLIPLA